MATLLTGRDLTKSFPSNELFEGVSIHIEDGDRIGLIGPNGGGKSTLMKILVGAVEADRGRKEMEEIAKAGTAQVDAIVAKKEADIMEV